MDFNVLAYAEEVASEAERIFYKLVHFSPFQKLADLFLRIEFFGFLAGLWRNDVFSFRDLSSWVELVYELGA